MGVRSCALLKASELTSARNLIELRERMSGEFATGRQFFPMSIPRLIMTPRVLVIMQGTESSVPAQDAEQQQGQGPDQVLVHDLLRAAIHSRAAYGYAMQAGHVASVLSFALMHTVHSLR